MEAQAEPKLLDLYATPVVTSAGDPFVNLKFGDQEGAIDADVARQHALALLEAAEIAEQEATMFDWLTRQPDSNEEGVLRIIRSLREHRHTFLHLADDTPDGPAAAPAEAPTDAT